MAPSTNISQKYLFANGNNGVMNTVGQFGNLIPQIAGQGYAEIAWFQQAIEAGASGNVEKIVNSVPNIIGGFAKLFGGGNTARVEAEDKVKETENNITAKGTETDAKIEENQQKIDDIIEQALANAEEIETNLATIKEQTEQKKQIEEKLEKHKQTIETAQAVLANPDATEEEKEQAKSDIELAGIAISSLAGEIQKLCTNITSLNETTESLQDKNETLGDLQAYFKTENDRLIEETNQQVQTMLQNIRIEFTQQAAVNQAEAVRLEAEAAALETGGGIAGVLTGGASALASEAEAAKLIEEAGQYNAAAGTYTGGIPSTAESAQVQITVPLTVGSNAINTAVNSCVNYIGAANNNINSCFDETNALGSSKIIENADLIAQTGEEITDAAENVTTDEQNNGNNGSQNPELKKSLDNLETLTA